MQANRNSGASGGEEVALLAPGLGDPDAPAEGGRWRARAPGRARGPGLRPRGQAGASVGGVRARHEVAVQGLDVPVLVHDEGEAGDVLLARLLALVVGEAPVAGDGRPAVGEAHVHVAEAHVPAVELLVQDDGVVATPTVERAGAAALGLENVRAHAIELGS